MRTLLPGSLSLHIWFLRFLFLQFIQNTCWVSSQPEHASFPPRGWNSYDYFCWIVREEDFLRSAEIISHRLKPYGYEGGACEESGRQWRAKDIGIKERACAWMPQGFMSVNTKLGAGRALLRSLYEQYAEWGVDFGN